MTTPNALWLEVLRGTSRHVGSIFSAVIFAPTLPDAAIEFFGAQGRAAAAIRVTAIVVVILVCLMIFWAESVLHRRRMRHVAARSFPVQQKDTLVLALSRGTRVRQPGDRDGRPTVGEILLDAVQPRRVVLVSAPGSESEEWLNTTRAALGRLGIDSTTLNMRSPDLVEWLLDDLSEKVEQDRANGGSWDKTSVVFDLTGGTVPISLAMLRVAADLDVECVYMSSVHDISGPRPGTQELRQIDPKTLVGGVP